MSVPSTAATAIATPARLQAAAPSILDDERSGSHVPAPAAGADTLKFSDLIALVNPLQHLPIIGPLYRKLTGDEPHPAIKSLGGLLYGGPMGLVTATINTVFEQATGRTMIDAVAEVFTGGPSPQALAGPPRSLLPESTIAQDAAHSAAPATRAAVTTPPSLPSASPAAATPPFTARQPGTRDLAWYQANAGARMPASINAGTATGSHAPSVPRSAGPSFLQGVSPAVPGGTAAAPAPSPTDFSQRLLEGLTKYRAFEQTALRGAVALDRLE